MNNSDLFMKKNASEEESNAFFLKDEELIEIYNALGFTSVVLSMSNNLLQDNNVLFATEGCNRYMNNIRCKLESEIMRRNMEIR